MVLPVCSIRWCVNRVRLFFIALLEYARLSQIIAVTGNRAHDRVSQCYCGNDIYKLR